MSDKSRGKRTCYDKTANGFHDARVRSRMKTEMRSLGLAIGKCLVTSK